jgi:hypothetical protein
MGNQDAGQTKKKIIIGEFYLVWTLHNCNQKTIRDPEKIKEYVDKLCKLIKVKKFSECIVANTLTIKKLLNLPNYFLNVRKLKLHLLFRI